MTRYLGLITTGGTIADLHETSAPNPDRRRHLTGKALLRRLSLPTSRARIRIEDLLDLPSSALKLSHILDITTAIERLRHRGCHGVVVTMGTDTLEEVAYGLALLVPKNARVVVTGAFFPPTDRQWDGEQNLRDSFTLAADAKNVWDVVVLFAGRIFCPAEVVKENAYSLHAFSSPAGPLGSVRGNSVRWKRPATYFPKVRISTIRARVDLVTCTLDMDPLALVAPRDSGADGVVLSALGAGHWFPAVGPALQGLVESSFPVVVTSRCGAGLRPPSSRMGTWETGWAAGMTWTSLSAPKARIRLIFELSARQCRERNGESESA